MQARNLEGLDVTLPDAFTGERNIVAIAFRRQHQTLVDSWARWFDEVAPSDPGLRFYEVPTIGRIWAPARRFIDGGMASAIRIPEILQRTLTYYGDVSRVTRPLGITNTSTITIVCVDRLGSVLWSTRGGYTPEHALELEAVLSAHRAR